MALDFIGGGGAARVIVTSDTGFSNLDAWSILFWFNADTKTDLDRLYYKSNTGDTAEKQLLIFSNLLWINISRSTDDADARAVGGAWSAGVWTCVVVTFTEGNAPILYLGDLTTALAVPTYNETPDAGAGTKMDDDLDLHIGNSKDFNDSFDGRIARFMFFDKELSQAEAQAQQFRPHQQGNVKIWHEYGYNGVGEQPDFSGNGNSGAVITATIVDHAPLSPPFAFDLGQGVLTTVDIRRHIIPAYMRSSA